MSDTTTKTAYRAIISVPVFAEDDEAAFEQAVEFAHGVMHPGSDTVAGHLEYLGQGDHGVWRKVYEDRGFRKQVPPVTLTCA